PQIATVVELHAIGVIVDRTERVGYVTIVGLVGPSVYAAARHAALRHGLAEHEVDDVGLMHQQVSRDAARIIPLEPPLAVPMRIPIALGRGAEELQPVGVLRVGLAANSLAPPR